MWLLNLLCWIGLLIWLQRGLGLFPTDSDGRVLYDDVGYLETWTVSVPHHVVFQDYFLDSISSFLATWRSLETLKKLLLSVFVFLINSTVVLVMADFRLMFTCLLGLQWHTDDKLACK